ncbi:MAG TPA: aminopeptidase [Lutibacter sp.]|nr:aminopeptidase [Lutibacter sp.]
MIQIVKWLLILLLTTISLFAQDTFSNKEGSKYQFKLIKDLEATKVENQNRTGTCWSFSTLSYLESEIIRLGHKPVNLSEMYIVRNAYIGKAVNYLRMNGHFNFAAGGAFHDIPWVIKRYGIVPQHEYMGLNYGYDVHNHNEMEAALKGMVDGFNKKKQDGKLTKNWKKAYVGVIDAYLGELPEDITKYTFKEDGVTYNPISYAKQLGLNMDDYIGITSYTHHPFYESFVLEVPDNWALKSVYNVPLDEFMDIMEDAIKDGYTFAWGADVSEKGFSSKDALAIVPEDMATIQEKGKDDEFFSGISAEKISNAFVQPVKERWVSQEERQQAFDEQTTTDDHGMHITGLVKDQKGTKYFIVKNSWGTTYNQKDGYFYASFPYVRYKTMNIMIHKDALSKSLRKKLGL